jgi:hypothetical protein
MAGSNLFLLDSTAIWQERNGGFLAASDVQTRLVGPTSGRSKNSATVEFISSRLLVSATIWDSGECEVITTSVEDDQSDPVVNVLELADEKAVVTLLDQIGARLVAER